MKLIGFLSPQDLQDFLFAWITSHLSHFAEVRVTPSKVPTSYSWVTIVPNKSQEGGRLVKTKFKKAFAAKEWSKSFKAHPKMFTPPMMEVFN